MLIILTRGRQTFLFRRGRRGFRDRGEHMATTGRAPQAPGAAELDEITVISRAQDGDLDAFEQLVDLYQGRIFRLAYRMLNNRPDAEDIVQETMIAAWRQLPVLATPAAFSGWIYRISTNKCLDQLRKHTTGHEVLTSDEELERQSQTSPAPKHQDGSDPSTSAELSVQMDELASQLAAVTHEQRACWLLREMHGHSYAQIAELLGISEASARGRIARARTQLAERMSSWR